MFFQSSPRIKSFAATALCLLCIIPVLHAQDEFTLMMDRFASSRVTCGFDYTLSGNGPDIEGYGTLVLQGDMFKMESNGLSIWCDGSEKWTADIAAKEVVVETVTTEASDVSYNPALLLISAGKDFIRSSAGVLVVVDGKQAKKWVLVPRNKAVGITSLILYTNTKCDAIISAILLTEDGAKMEISFDSFELSPLSGSEEFTRSENSFGPSYVITDLR